MIVNELRNELSILPPIQNSESTRPSPSWSSAAQSVKQFQGGNSIENLFASVLALKTDLDSILIIWHVTSLTYQFLNFFQCRESPQNSSGFSSWSLSQKLFYWNATQCNHVERERVLRPGSPAVPAVDGRRALLRLRFSRVRAGGQPLQGTERNGLPWMMVVGFLLVQ